MVRSAWSKEMHTWGVEKGSEQCGSPGGSLSAASHGLQATVPPRALSSRNPDNSPTSWVRPLRLGEGDDIAGEGGEG